MPRRRRIEAPLIMEDEPLWYKDAIIYELHVRAFADSNGDGVGDFAGLVSKLDYLQDLGVTALWILPFYPSPLRDDGYDISAYTDVHPTYGTLADFELFLREAHRRGIRVITELVLNHSSDQHPWFQRARRSPPGSPERDFYVWSDTPDKYQDARIIFKDFEPSNWSWDPVAHSYFWHRFYSHQPDLNYNNPAVRQAMFEVVDFWLNKGIDGLRLDAVPYLYEREGTNCENLPETHTYLKELRRHVDGIFKNRMLLAEANQWPEDAVAYFGNGDECHMAFHFPVMPRLFMAIRMENRLPIVDILQQTPAIPENSQWALFLRNHDELTLEMVTDEDRDYMYRVYAQDPQARINLGIRRRLASLLENHRGKIELMNGLLFSLPGTPVLYYGDEIGMGDNIYLGDRNGVRAPMQWNGERNAGFSPANPQRLYLPVIIDPEYHYQVVNVETQQNNPHSLLWWMKRLIALRKRYRAFGRGGLEFLEPDNYKILAFIRRYEEECILVTANLSRFVQCAQLDLSAFKGMVPVEMLGRTHFPTISDAPYFLTLSAHAIYWFRLEPQHAGLHPSSYPEEDLTTLEVADSWENVFKGKVRVALAEILAYYLPKCPWYTEVMRTVETASVIDAIPFTCEKETIYWCLLHVEYTEGDPVSYVLPMSFKVSEPAREEAGNVSPGVMARLLVRPRGASKENTVEGVLYDPLGDKEVAQALLQAVAQQRHCKGTAGELRAWTTDAWPSDIGLAALTPRLVQHIEQGSSAIIYGDQLMLKLFRRLEDGTSPDLDISRFLREKTSFTNFLPIAAALEYVQERNEPMTIAVLRMLMPGQTRAWGYTQDSLSLFFERALTLQIAAQDLPLSVQPLLDLIDKDIPPLAQEVIGSYLASVELLGQRTAEFHLALSSDSGDPNLSPEPFTGLVQRSMYQSLRSQTRQALELLQLWLKDGDITTERALAEKTLSRESEIFQRGRMILDRKITAMQMRCHGDYHLGQLLFTGKDFVIIDFEGPRLRPISDRRRKRSPLRDVASMLRSFHNATLAAMSNGATRPEDVPTLRPWVRLWQLWVSVAFVKAYLARAGQAAFLPKNREDFRILLDFYLLKRAVNELRYDLATHGQRVKISLQGLEQILETKS